ncbi:MAG: HU family DNA-binding protein [Candidatus Eisenbacteria bacterium]|jgi:nucleoid DNA-binding protein|nr:HU family DNA-binding protein [Candidatus Eisenbacteria bacterium]
MKVSELEAALSQRVGTSRMTTRHFIAALRDTVAERLLADDKVVIPGLGTFRRVVRGPRRCYNPVRRKQATLPPHGALTFTPALKLREKLRTP